MTFSAFLYFFLQAKLEIKMYHRAFNFEQMSFLVIISLSEVVNESG